jgi:hypothetical protein
MQRRPSGGQSSWSAFTMSTGRVLLGCSLSCSITAWLHPWVCMGVPSLDGSVLKLSLHVLACCDISHLDMGESILSMSRSEFQTEILH